MAGLQSTATILNGVIVIFFLVGHYNVRLNLNVLRYIQIEGTRRRLANAITISITICTDDRNAGNGTAAVVVAATTNAARGIAASRRLLGQVLRYTDATADAHQAIAFVGRLHFVFILSHHFPFRKVFMVLLVVQNLVASVRLMDNVLGRTGSVTVGYIIVGVVVVHGQVVVVVVVYVIIVVVIVGCH